MIIPSIYDVKRLHFLQTTSDPIGINVNSRGGGGGPGSIFARYVPLASPNPHSIIVYSVANYRPHVSHFWTNIL